MLPKFNSPVCEEPFLHAIAENSISDTSAELILNWFETNAPWKLKVASFYQQYEFDILNTPLPVRIANIFSNKSLLSLKKNIENTFKTSLSHKISVVAHKLTKGQVIKIHNDFRPGKESHRVLMQFNRGWDVENGGILMLFSSESSESVTNAFLPIHKSAFAFEISEKSLHAVSSIVKGERYTVVLSFYQAGYEYY